jgi:hypothetical protein
MGKEQQNWEYIAGPVGRGEYSVGNTIRFEEDGRELTGEVLHVAAPGQTVTGKHTPTSYYVDCGDGFPHVVYQSQIKA